MTSNPPPSEPRPRRWRVYGVDLARWIERYRIKPFTSACLSCGELLRIDVPFVFGHARGLTGPPCSACGAIVAPHSVTLGPWGDDDPPRKPRSRARRFW